MIDQNKELREKLSKLREQGHFVFIPAATLPATNGLFVPTVEPITLIVDDYYPTQGKFGLKHFALMKLADAAGIQWASETGHVGRVDNRDNSDYCSFRVVARVRTSEGLWKEVPAHKHLDLAARLTAIETKHADTFDNKKKWEGKKGKFGVGKAPWPSTKNEYIKKYTDRDIGQLRENIDERCESGAQSRAIRNIMHIPANFPADQKNNNVPASLGIKFYITRYILDPNSPEVKAAQLASFQNAMGSIYGAPVIAPPPYIAPPPEKLPEPKPEDSTIIDPLESEFVEKSFGEKLTTIESLVKSSGYKFHKNDTEKSPLQDWSDEELLDYYKHLLTEANKK